MDLESEQNEKIGTKVFIFIGVFALIFLVGFASYIIPRIQKHATGYEINSPVLRKRVLVATQSSRFKDEFVSNFTSRLGEKPVHIRIDDITVLEETDPADWNAIVIISSIRMTDIKKEAREFIENAEHPERIILVTTSSADEWDFDDSRLDIISSASDEYEMDTLLYGLLARVKLILE